MPYPAGRHAPATTPHTAIRAALYDQSGALRTAQATLHHVLYAARPVAGGPTAAHAVASRAAPPQAECGAARPATGGAWRPLVWLRPDQAYAAPYALERGCAVLVAGTECPEGWEIR